MSLDSKLKELVGGVEVVVKKFDDFEKKYTQKLDISNERLDTLEKAVSKDVLRKYGDRGKLPDKIWSWHRLFAALGTKNWKLAPFEYEEIQKHVEFQQKTMQAGDFSGGGSLIPPQYIAELIEFLRPEMITDRLGVRILTGLTGSPILIPKLTAGASYYWVAPESTAITASEQKTGRIELQPKKVAALVKMSRELVTLSNPAVEATTRTDIIRSLQEGIDTAFFQGIGSSGQPLGLSNWVPAILDAGGTWSGNGADDYKDLNILKDLRKKLGNANALRGNIQWAMNVESWESVDRLVDGNKRPFLQVDPADGFRATLLGFPARMSTLVAPTSGTGLNRIYLGNWEDALIAIWNQIQIETSTEAATAFQNDELWIKATALVDVGIRRNVSFCKQDAVDIA